MKIPAIQGKLNQSGPFIYAACDHNYFFDFGKPIINSIKKNSQFGIHLHLYNPTAEQLEYCEKQDRLSFTYEYVPLEMFKEAADRWNSVTEQSPNYLNLKRILTAMSKSNDVSIQERIQRTYFACARFIRLFELINSKDVVLAIDIDAIVRNTIPLLPNTCDFYIHHITGKKARFLAGGIYLNGNEKGYQFLSEYAEVLKINIENDNLHWGIDQDVLDHIVPKYQYSNLPLAYIDWEMSPNSYVWTAKGKRKDLDIFINEQKKYTS